jgi:hypothetical protein
MERVEFYAHRWGRSASRYYHYNKNNKKFAKVIFN